MSPQLNALIRKECRERRWQLVATTTWVLGSVLYTVVYALTHRLHAPIPSFGSGMFLFGDFAAIFLAMRTALGETTRKTIGFSASLPVSLRQIAGVRLGGAIAVLTAPILLAAVIFSGLLLSGVIDQMVSGYHDLAKGAPPLLTTAQALGFLWKVAAIQIAQAIELLLVLVVIGARRRSEVQIGFIGAIFAFLSLALTQFHVLLQRHGGPLGGTLLCAFFPQSLAFNHGYMTELGSFGDLVILPWAWPSLAGNLLLLVALAFWFVRRYGPPRTATTESPSTGRRWGLPGLLSRLPMHWPGKLSALVWMDLRQSLPLAASGLLLAVLMTVLGILMEQRDSDPLSKEVTGNLPQTTWYLAMIWATVVGSGIFTAELQPGLGQFWRSRPIRPAVWFWVKYLIGLIAVVGVLDGVTIAVSWQSPAAEPHFRMSWSYVACIPLLHAMMYSMAVCGVCWLRKAVPGAMAGVLLLFAATLILDAIPGAQAFDEIRVHNALVASELKGQFDLSQHHYPVVYGTIGFIAVTAAGLAARAISRPQSPLARRQG